MRKLILLVALILSFTACKKPSYRLAGHDDTRVIVDSASNVSNRILNIIAPFKDSLNQITNRVVGHSEQTMYTGKPESHLTNFVADLLLKDIPKYLPADFEQPIDFSIMNVYGLRAPIAKGSVTVGDIFRVMPFENRLSIVGLKGADVQELFDGFAARGGEGVSGARFGIKHGKAVDVIIGGAPLDTTKVYYIALSDYLADGGAEMVELKNKVSQQDLPVLLRDAILWHIEALEKENKGISVQLDNRVYEAK